MDLYPMQASVFFFFFSFFFFPSKFNFLGILNASSLKVIL